ncbi:TetR/AcrR family transcriptional regulator [Photobacterium lutimaris]|uniref:TetR/AcrR family transcriptional regulator n=1 Tax=Photobacterium lutimaris TaxID=388278 RepID=UPI001414F729|nr:TetR/AcrR family transcriptional regulator [Photobacterium lutimaris]
MKTRKQRELAIRHDLIIHSAAELIRSEGMNAVRMERLAQITEYSKGTVYQHFSGREDVLMTVSNRILAQQMECISELKHAALSLREQLIAMVFVNRMITNRHHGQLELLRFVQSADCHAKAADKTVEEHSQYYSALVDSVYGVIREAVNKKELQLGENRTVDDVFYSIWAFSFGVTYLDSLAQIRESKICPTIPDNKITTLISAAFDNLNWRPLSRKYHDDELYLKVKDICNKIN